jgi:hypothetical protein
MYNDIASRDVVSYTGTYDSLRHRLSGGPWDCRHIPVHYPAWYVLIYPTFSKKPPVIRIQYIRSLLVFSLFKDISLPKPFVATKISPGKDWASDLLLTRISTLTTALPGHPRQLNVDWIPTPVEMRGSRWASRQHQRLDYCSIRVADKVATRKP